MIKDFFEQKGFCNLSNEDEELFRKEGLPVAIPLSELEKIINYCNSLANNSDTPEYVKEQQEIIVKKLEGLMAIRIRNIFNDLAKSNPLAMLQLVRIIEDKMPSKSDGNYITLIKKSVNNIKKALDKNQTQNETTT